MVLLPHAPASVVAARSRISTDLREAGIVPPAIGDAALVVSELLTNAILHARPLPGARVLVACGCPLTGHRCGLRLPAGPTGRSPWRGRRGR